MKGIGPLLEFLKALPSDEARERFATACKTSLGHLRNVAYGYKPGSAELAIEVERESRGLVTAELVCPRADWAVIRGTGGMACEQGSMSG